MTSKLSRHSSRNVPTAKPRACRTCGSPWHSICRSTPLERGGRVNPRREEPRRVDRATGRVDEPTPAERLHMRKVRALRCKALGLPGHERCSGEMVGHHAGRHAAGQKCSHYDTVPLCWTAHEELHAQNGNGWAADLSGEQIREHEDQWIAEVHDDLGVDSNGPIERASVALPF